MDDIFSIPAWVTDVSVDFRVDVGTVGPDEDIEVGPADSDEDIEVGPADSDEDIEVGPADSDEDIEVGPVSSDEDISNVVSWDEDNWLVVEGSDNTRITDTLILNCTISTF